MESHLTPNPAVVAIVVAAGIGARVGGVPKQYRLIGGEAVLTRAIRALLASPQIEVVLPVIHADHAEYYAALALTDPRLLAPVWGDATRQGSVLKGLEALQDRQPGLVLIHDAARPFADRALVENIIGAINTLINYQGVLPVLPISNTIKRSLDGRTVARTEDRSQLFEAQTPQGFVFADILAAHRRAAAQGEHAFTDDSAIAEWAGLAVALTSGSPRNIKLTTPEDFAVAERVLMGDLHMETRVGMGLDVHPFAPGDGLWLGGVLIPYSCTLEGHSDADVALHALCDAIYGALGEGDIGVHFPPSDAQWKGAASATFLKHAAGLVAQRNGRIVNLDLTIICEAPQISPHAAAMRQTIGAICGMSPNRVAIKATTSEKLGFAGRGEGIVAMATASIELPRED